MAGRVALVDVGALLLIGAGFALYYRSTYNTLVTRSQTVDAQ